MFFLVDYFNYVTRRGRFREGIISNGPMSFALSGMHAEFALSLLGPGDMLFVQTLRSPRSWLVMYLSSSTISHVAMMADNAQVFHATTGGVVAEPANTLLTGDVMVLPARLNLSSKDRLSVLASSRAMVGMPYGWRVVIIKGVRIFLGRDWPWFRWIFFLDAAFLAALIDIPLFLLTGRAFLVWGVGTYLLLILFFAAYWQFKPLPFDETTAKPQHLLRMVEQKEGELLLDAVKLFGAHKKMTSGD